MPVEEFADDGPVRLEHSDKCAMNWLIIMESEATENATFAK